MIYVVVYEEEGYVKGIAYESKARAEHSAEIIDHFKPRVVPVVVECKLIKEETI